MQKQKWEKRNSKMPSRVNSALLLGVVATRENCRWGARSCVRHPIPRFRKKTTQLLSNSFTLGNILFWSHFMIAGSKISFKYFTAHTICLHWSKITKKILKTLLNDKTIWNTRWRTIFSAKHYQPKVIIAGSADLNQ